MIPGMVREGQRSIGEMTNVFVSDAGADGNATTQGDNTRFLTQGLFIP